MAGLFNYQNGFFSFMSKVWDMMVLSLLWVVCCIPLITIGPATTALYYTVVKVVRRERGYILKEFWHSFKQNFKYGILSNLIFIVAGLILVFDLQYANIVLKQGQGIGNFLMAAFIAVSVMYVFTLAFCYPVLSRFTVNLSQLFKTSFFMAIKHFPTTIAVVIMTGVFGFFSYYILPIIVLTPAVCCLLCSLSIERVFKKYMKNEDQDSENTMWYME